MYSCVSGCSPLSLWRLLIEGRRGGKSSSVVTVCQGWNTLLPSRYSIKQKGFAWTWVYFKLNCFPTKSDPRKPHPERLCTAAASPQQLGWTFSCGAEAREGSGATQKSGWNKKKPLLLSTASFWVHALWSLCRAIGPSEILESCMSEKKK